MSQSRFHEQEAEMIQVFRIPARTPVRQRPDGKWEAVPEGEQADGETIYDVLSVTYPILPLRHRS